MRFTKIAQAGNDYILTDINELGSKTDAPTIKMLCDRHYGIGADGVIIKEERPDGSTVLKMWNPDGTKAASADIGAAGAAALDGYFKDGRIKRQLFCENHAYDFLISDVCEKSAEITSELGKGSFMPQDIPLASSEPVIEKPVEVLNRILRLTAVNTAGSHTVFFTDSPENINVPLLGDAICRHSLFKKMNDAVFVNKNNDGLNIHVYKKGAGEVNSSVSAAAGAVLAACRTGRLPFGTEITVNCKDSEIFIVCKKDFTVLADFRAAVVFSGVF